MLRVALSDQAAHATICMYIAKTLDQVCVTKHFFKIVEKRFGKLISRVYIYEENYGK